MPPTCAEVLDYSVPVATLALCFTIFSAYTVVVKAALNDGTSPLVLAFLREVLALAVLMPTSYLRARWTAREGKPLKFWIASEDWIWIVLLGLTMVWGVQLLSALALKAVTALNYAMLAPSVPPMCLAFALLTGHEHFDRRSYNSWLKVGGISVAAAGTVVVAATASSEAGAVASSAVILGNVLLFTNKICIAIYPIIEKRLILKGYEPVSIVAWGYASGSALTMLSVIPYLVLAPSGGWDISASGWRAICFAAFLTSALNYSLMIYVNKKVGPVLVMAFYPWQAICTPLLASAFLGSVLTANDAVGGILVVIGLALCVLAKWRERGVVAAAAAAAAAATAANEKADTDAAVAQQLASSTVDTFAVPAEAASQPLAGTFSGGVAVVGTGFTSDVGGGADDFVRASDGSLSFAPLVPAGAEIVAPASPPSPPGLYLPRDVSP